MGKEFIDTITRTREKSFVTSLLARVSRDFGDLKRGVTPYPIRFNVLPAVTAQISR